jgi:hypothetical protein
MQRYAVFFEEALLFQKLSRSLKYQKLIIQNPKCLKNNRLWMNIEFA